MPQEQGEIQRLIMETLARFGIALTAGDILRGPSYTRYEFNPPSGLQLSRVVALRKELMPALKARRLNILAPVPGKDTVGIEVENSVKEPVYLGELLQSWEYAASPCALPLLLGKDVSGDVILRDLAAMSHTLVAGAPGTGKSVCLHGMILSLVCKLGPEELRLLLIDPKGTEWQVYHDLSHLACPVISTAACALKALQWAAEEAERRLSLFRMVGVTDIAPYNRLQREGEEEALNDEEIPVFDSPGELPTPLPHIVILIDELAVLMQEANAETESLLARLTQNGSAAGIILVLATQSPCSSVLPGHIMANIPSRIAFRTMSPVDSRAILDSESAADLDGAGDCLVRCGGDPVPLRHLQAAFLSDREIRMSARCFAAPFLQHFEPALAWETASAPSSVDGDQGNSPQKKLSTEDAELYERCVKLVIEERKASTALLQRRFNIGYGKAALILDAMEENGIVGPAQGASRPREVLVD